MAISLLKYLPITINQTCRLRAKGFEIIDGIYTGRTTTEATGNYNAGSTPADPPIYRLSTLDVLTWASNTTQFYIEAPTPDAIMRYRVYGYVKKGWEIICNTDQGSDTLYSTGEPLYSGWRALPPGYSGEAFRTHGRWWWRAQAYTTRPGYADSLTIDHYLNIFDGPKTPPPFPE